MPPHCVVLPTLAMLERRLSRFAYLQALHSQQIAACNRPHKVGERLARWLLITQDRVRFDFLPLTPDLVARMLGTRRAGVTVAAGILQQAGIIEYRRGQIQDLNCEKLEEAACECNPVLREQLDTYLEIDMVANSTM